MLLILDTANNGTPLELISMIIRNYGQKYICISNITRFPNYSRVLNKVVAIIKVINYCLLDFVNCLCLSFFIALVFNGECFFYILRAVTQLKAPSLSRI